MGNLSGAPTAQLDGGQPFSTATFADMQISTAGLYAFSAASPTDEAVSGFMQVRYILESLKMCCYVSRFSLLFLSRPHPYTRARKRKRARTRKHPQHVRYIRLIVEEYEPLRLVRSPHRLRVRAHTAERCLLLIRPS